MKYKNKLSIADIKRLNKEAGQFWFEPATMRFFRTQLPKNTIGGDLFVTSEQFVDPTMNYVAPRKYSIRQFKGKTGSIETLGEFQQFESGAKARAVAKKLAMKRKKYGRKLDLQKEIKKMLDVGL